MQNHRVFVRAAGAALGLILLAGGLLFRAGGARAGLPFWTPFPLSLQASPVLAVADIPVEQVAVASLRKDGRPDLITTSVSFAPVAVNLLGVQLSDGHGGYARAVTYPLKGAYSDVIAVGDFNGDGFPDVFVGSSGGSVGAQVFLGRGDGTLRPPLDTASLDQVSAVAVGDFDGDGKLDVAATSLQRIGVTVLRGLGNGKFAAPVRYDTQDLSTLLDIKAADVNGDGSLDLVVARQNGDVTILPGKGDGTFGAAKRVIIAPDTRVSHVFVGDFNGDGKPDIVAGGDFGGGAGTSLLVGNGDGTFKTPVKVGGLVVYNVADLDGDGKLDLVTLTDGPRQILLGNGDGTFHASALFYGQSGGSVTADINNDGHLDLVSPGLGVTITYGNGDGTFRASHTVFSGESSSSAPYAVALGDFDGDGKPDMAVANAQENTVSIFKGDGTGGFTRTADIPVGSTPVALIAVDLDRDGRRDLVVVDEFGDDLALLAGNGDGTFQPPTFLATGRVPLAVATGDFNHDGIPDLAVANGSSNSVSIFLGLGDGAFRAPSTIAVGIFPSGVTIADFNGDGNLDVATANQGSDTVSIAPGRGNGAFDAPSTLAVGAAPYALAAGDLNRDGKPDVVTANSGDSTVSVLLNLGGGRFGTAQALRVGTLPSDPSFVALGDINGDGNLDIVTANDIDQSVSVLLNQGKGVFAASQEYFGGSGSVGLALGDVNRDRRLDIVVANRFQSDVSILLNTTGRHFASPLPTELKGGGPYRWTTPASPRPTFRPSLRSASAARSAEARRTGERP